VGTIASIDAALRGLDRKAEDEQREIERQKKALAEYRGQLGQAFEHEARLKELTVKQAQLNAALDLDKHEAQVVADAPETGEKGFATGFVARIGANDRATAMTL